MPKMHHVFQHLHRDDYNKLLQSQNGKCKICGISALELSKRLHIDHDHKTGEVRGLLCHACNLGLGYFRDNPEFLLFAISYLEGEWTGMYLADAPIRYKDAGYNDWRLLTPSQKEEISVLGVEEIVTKYRVSRATAYNWKRSLS